VCLPGLLWKSFFCKSVVWWVSLWTNSIFVFLWSGHLLCYKPFLEIKYLGTSFIFKTFYGLKIGAKTHFKTRSLPKLVFIKLQGHSVVIPLLYNSILLLTFLKGFQKSLRKLYKGDNYVSSSFQNYLQKLYSLGWNSFQVHHGMIFTTHLFNHCFQWC
jgi:hypothetical protein